MVSDLSAGFQEDCFGFIQNFVKRESYDFSVFCSVWNELHFHNIFYERQSIEELTKFIEEIFLIIKRIMLRKGTEIEKICCLYLLYGIYVKQPEKDAAKIRLCQSDWETIKGCYNTWKGEKYKDAFAIFWQLLLLDAYYFCLTESKYRSDHDKEREQQSIINPDLVFKPFSGALKAELNDIESKFGILNSLQAFEIAYNEMKDQSGASNQDSGLPSTALVDEVRESLNKIQNTMEKGDNIKRKRRYKKSNTKNVEESYNSEEETIKDKRKAIKSKALKVEKKKKTDVATTSQSQTDSSTKLSPRKNIVDQKHFKKITLVQEIFEHNFTLGNIEMELGLKEETPIEDVIATTFMSDHNEGTGETVIIKSEEEPKTL